jgi:hypothetical protein
MDGVGPGRHLVEVAAPQWSTLDPREDERFGLRADEQRQVLAQGWDDR